MTHASNTVLNPKENVDAVEALTQRFIDGDVEAFTELYQKVRGILISHIRQIFRGAYEEDIFSEAMDAAWRKRHTYNQRKGKLVFWLTSIARKKAIDFLRRVDARERMLDRYKTALSSDPSNRIHHEDTGIRHLFQEEEGQRILEIMKRHLTEVQVQVMTLHWIARKSQRTISDEQNIPLGTVKDRLKSGLGNLIRHVQREPFYKDRS
ncbi:MAG: sigma-70 family RNA polymerase sigma factor [Candidatus Pacebacteria bacterium]|nr:sigma-70 family RNA polymerase sigma factor [Candidatus Paceibacterota bacterium]